MKLLKVTYKMPFILSAVVLDFTKNIVIPGQNLMTWLFIVFIIDFITGIIKAYLTKEPITSKRMRDSIGKMLQYAGMIILVIILANASFKEQIAKAAFMVDGIYMLAILIETRSIAENFKAMAPDSALTKLVLNPMLLVFEKQIKDINSKLPTAEAKPEAPDPISTPTVTILLLCLALPMFSMANPPKLTYDQQQFLNGVMPAIGVGIALLFAAIILMLCAIGYMHEKNKKLKKP